MTDYKNYLAENILTEDKLVTYRLLSRALKVHVNSAKEMLYDFHRQQNAKKPGTLHATYLISGTKREEEVVPINGDVKMEDRDGDDYMQSSPFMASSMPQVEDGSGATSVLSITLAREEDLDAIKAQYTHISSIHIYSLGPSPLKDLQMLSDITRQIQTLTSVDDPLKTNSTYGIITNPLVKRRTARRPPPVAAPAPAVKAVNKPPPSSKPAAKEPPKLTKQDSKTSQTSNSNAAKDFFGKGKEKTKTAAGNKDSAPSSKESTPAPNAPPALKRESSSLFKAFAKAKPPKEKKEKEDEVMKDVVSDDDDDEETYVPPVQEKKESGADRKSRKEREEALKRMMDEEDDEEEDSTPASKVATPADIDDDEDEEMESQPPKKKAKSVEPEAYVTVAGGRRRGRKVVKKKVTVKDEEGYLVTKEETGFESFSEDEPVAKAKPRPVVIPAAKGKKSTAKPGQGNIMSFFGKK